MATVNSEAMGLSADDLNDMDRWILEYLTKHEWASPNLIRETYHDDRDDGQVSRQWVSARINRLREHDHVEKVHPNSSEYQLVDDPREE